MSIIAQIKKDRVTALKAGDKDTASFLSYVSGTLDAIGKNAGNRDTTDDEAIAAIKKIVQKNNETMELSKTLATDDSLNSQNRILEVYLPQMVGPDELAEFITTLNFENPNKGLYMKEVKAKYGQTVDMKVAGNIIDMIMKG